jgi:hypothetical protein
MKASSIRTWLAVVASVAAAVVLAAPAAATDTEYTPFVTDFPRAVAAGESSTSGGFDWLVAGGLAVGVGLVALVALLARRRTRIVAPAALVAAAAPLAAGSSRPGLDVLQDNERGAKR